MADDTQPAIGMSVGATTLVAVTADRAITRRPVLTLYQNRSSEIGTPAENSNIDGPGLVIADFVDQVGGSAPVQAADGSAHRGEQLLADGLHALAYIATEGSPLPPAVAVTHPAHWPAPAVDALRAALSRVPEWSPRPVALTSDVAAALTALQTNPGLPDNGILAVCDFGGTGTSLTLVDAAEGHQVIGATVRHTEFSGELLDQALLNHVIDDLTASGSLVGTLAIGSLNRLRAECRHAKEQLSTNTVTELTVDLPGFRGGIWVTRAELDEVIREPLDDVFAAVQEMLNRNGIQADSLAAIASVGGGAHIPAVTTGLAQRLGVTVISSPRPHLTAAIGAALEIARDPGETSENASAPAAPPPAAPPPAEAVTAPPQPPTPPPAPPVAVMAPQPSVAAMAPQPQPQPQPAPSPVVEQEPAGDQPDRARTGWYRRPVMVILAVALAVLIAGAVAVLALRYAAGSEPATSTIPSEMTTTFRAPTPTSTRSQPSQSAELPTVPPMPEVPETLEAP